MLLLQRQRLVSFLLLLRFVNEVNTFSFFRSYLQQQPWSFHTLPTTTSPPQLRQFECYNTNPHGTKYRPTTIVSRIAVYCNNEATAISESGGGDQSSPSQTAMNTTTTTKSETLTNISCNSTRNANTIRNMDATIAATAVAPPMMMNNIVWKIRPCEHPTMIQLLQWYASGIYETIGMVLKQQSFSSSSSSILFPRQLLFDDVIQNRNTDNTEHQQRNNMIVVLATGPNHQVIGRFGIVPPSRSSSITPTPLRQATQRLYPTSTPQQQQPQVDEEEDEVMVPPRVGAIIYMYIEPEYRGRRIGTMALQVIHTIQRYCHGTHIILVANDKTPSLPSLPLSPIPTSKSDCSGDLTAQQQPQPQQQQTNRSSPYDDMKLVQWYLRHGYQVAPELQDMLGSPNGMYGITMMTSLLLEDNDEQPESSMSRKSIANDTRLHRSSTPIIQWW